MEKTLAKQQQSQEQEQEQELCKHLPGWVPNRRALRDI